MMGNRHTFARTQAVIWIASLACLSWGCSKQEPVSCPADSLEINWTVSGTLKIGDRVLDIGGTALDESEGIVQCEFVEWTQGNPDGDFHYASCTDASGAPVVFHFSLDGADQPAEVPLEGTHPVTNNSSSFRLDSVGCRGLYQGGQGTLREPEAVGTVSFPEAAVPSGFYRRGELDVVLASSTQATDDRCDEPLEPESVELAFVLETRPSSTRPVGACDGTQ